MSVLAKKSEVIPFPDQTSSEISDRFRNLTRLVDDAKDDPTLLDSLANKILEDVGTNKTQLTDTLRTLLRIIEQQVDEKHTDTLTGAFNRRYLEHAIAEQLEIAKNISDPTQSRQPTATKGAALLYLDIDYFKALNDTYGHAIGDRALIEFTQHVSRTVRDFDVVARVGGDEFVVLLKDISPEDAQKVREKVNEAVANVKVPAIDVEDEVVIGASVGMAVINSDYTVETFLNRADESLYQVKQNGRNALTRR